MKGFKSFADKTKIEFDNRITAVVGPNGSGKSNISDAVKWVLGEQSIKSLRGKKMPDVIFAGGENSKPLNMAQVDLVFTNEDKTLDLPYDLVKISRRIYRNGDNEYKINGKKVRLKDIKELFLDTGVGKEGYSVIGQGRIDEIINSSPKERRAIFEEASGISKHKYRRDESEKKLEKVSENLEIIDREWEYKKKELDSLKVQKENFEKNQSLSQDLDTKAYFYFHKKSNKLIKFCEDVTIKIKAMEKSQEEKSLLLDNLNKRLLPFKEESESLAEDLKNSAEKISYLEKSIDKAKSQSALKDQDLSYKKRDLERNETDRAKGLERKKELEEKIRLDKNSLKETEEKLDSFRKDQKEKEDLVKSLEAGISKAQLRVKNLTFEKSALDKKIYEYDLNEKTNIILSQKRQEEEKKLREKAQAFDAEIADLDRLIKDLENSANEREKNLKEGQNSLTSKQKDFADLLKSQDDIKESLTANQLSLKEELANYKIQKDLLARNEGYFYPVQEFLKASKNAGMEALYLDTLANLINVKNGYEDLIEILMGASLQNIVTRTKDDTRELIKLINQKRLGRITFLPLDSIRSFRKKKPQAPEVIAMAYDLVKYNPSLTNIIDQFLGSTVVVKDIDDAISLSKKITGYRIITLDLDVINTWGSMVAGKNSRKRSNVGIINRSKRIEEIKRKVVFLRDKNKDLTNDLAKVESRLKDGRKELDLLSEDLNKIKEEIQDLNGDLRHKNFEKDSLVKRKDELFESLNQELEEKDLIDIDFVRNKLGQTEEDLEKLKKSLDQDQTKLIDTRSSLIELKNKIDLLTRDKNLLLNSLAENETSLKNLIDSHHFADKVRGSLENEISDLSKDIENLRKKSKEDQRLLQEEIEKRKNLKASIEEKTKANQDMVQKSKALEKELSDLSLDLVKINYKKEAYQKDIENLEDEISPFLSQSLEDLEKINKDKKDFDVNKTDLIKIQREINKVGFFTEDSLSLYEEAYKDFDFLDKQKKDLETSKLDIEKMIKKLESQMKDEFIKNFKIIDDKFQRIFQILFMGGKAKLSLDEEDELAAGIEIMACPPGKSSKSISLLSGGEKALTAVALLFALFETNPAPFSLLDEIDAALDESNIKRYIDYLKSLSDKTQFVMITHRQTTMQLAERIHGVTIGDDGISKVYSIDFDEN